MGAELVHGDEGWVWRDWDGWEWDGVGWEEWGRGLGWEGPVLGLRVRNRICTARVAVLEVREQ